MKTCFTCGLPKPEDDYFTNTKKPGWADGTCKRCRQDQNNKRRQERRVERNRQKSAIVESEAFIKLDKMVVSGNIGEALVFIHDIRREKLKAKYENTDFKVQLKQMELACEQILERAKL